MGEERVGFPSDFFYCYFFFFRAARKKCQRGRGYLHGSVVHIYKKVEAAKEKKKVARIDSF